MPHSEAILERMLRLTDRVIENRDRISKLEIDMVIVKKELQDKSTNSTFSSIITFLKEVMPTQWWVLLIFLLLGSILGIISPRDVINQLIGQSPREQTEHSG